MTPPRISVVCGCMDRHEMLEQALASWLPRAEIGEVVVVDWSSRTPVQALADRIGDARVRVVRVEGQRTWVASMSHNLGVRMASGEILLRLDADHVLRPGFFEAHALDETSFFAGNWRVARDENEKHLTGVLLVHRRRFFDVNGYNERISTYGYEDEDLFDRLQGVGLERRDVDPDTVVHIPHSDAMRIRNQHVLDPHREADSNRWLARARPWGHEDLMTAWDVRRQESGVLVCEEIPSRWTESEK